MRKFSHISLFSGAGGFDIGLEESGFETRVMVENDRNCHQTLHLNRRAASFRSEILGDITKLTPSDVLEQSGCTIGEINLLSGGPPCQSFSTAGKRLSIRDPRGSLFDNFVSMIDFMQPQFFLMENVRGLLSAAVDHRPLRLRGDGHPPLTKYEQLGSVFELKIMPSFKKLGYQVIIGLLNSLDYGAAQDRKRLIILGSRDKEFPTDDIDELLPPTHSKDGAAGTSPYVILGDVIKDLEDCPGPYMEYSKERKRIYKMIPPGKNWRYIRDSEKFTIEDLKNAMGGAYTSTGGRVGFWRRLSYDKWSPTVTTSPVQKATGLCHPTALRPLSIKEYARIQGFPDNWEFAGSIASQYRQIGNAVPIPLGSAIGKLLRSVIQSSSR